MMTSVKLGFHLTCLACLFLAQVTEQKLSFHQEGGFLSVKAGEELTLKCFYEGDDAAGLFWYKQSYGQKPQLISTFYVFEQNGIFYDEFQNNPRFTLHTGTGKNHLKISDLRISDSAVYYCTSVLSFRAEFAEGITVSIKSSGVNIPALVHQSPFESIQPGVTLNCTVHTGSCDGEHTFYWFKPSEESHPGLIYTHGGRNDQCERKANTQTHTCVYNLPMENQNLYHAGTYYCAVASCGHILFGDGTKLNIEDEKGSNVLVYFLGAALTVTTIVFVSLAFITYKLMKRNRQCSDSRGTLAAAWTSNAEGHRDVDNLPYAAVNVHLPNKSRRQRNTPKNDCVYSTVKQ